MFWNAPCFLLWIWNSVINLEWFNVIRVPYSYSTSYTNKREECSHMEFSRSIKLCPNSCVRVSPRWPELKSLMEPCRKKMGLPPSRSHHPRVLRVSCWCFEGCYCGRDQYSVHLQCYLGCSSDWTYKVHLPQVPNTLSSGLRATAGISQSGFTVSFSGLAHMSRAGGWGCAWEQCREHSMTCP